MKNVEILSHTDRTSWSRIWMVAKFYMPVIRQKMILFPLISIIIGLIMALGKGYLPKEAYISLVMSCSIFIMYLSIFGGSMPLAKMKAIEIETMLPALNFEKCAFVIIYALIIVPILVYLPCNIIWWINNGYQTPSQILAELSPDAYLMFKGNEVWMILTFLSVMLSFSASGLWGAMAAKRHRMWWSFAGVMLAFAGYIVLCFILGVGLGFYVAFSNIVYDSAAFLPIFIKFLVCILTFYGIFALWMVCRSISRRQI